MNYKEKWQGAVRAFWTVVVAVAVSLMYVGSVAHAQIDTNAPAALTSNATTFYNNGLTIGIAVAVIGIAVALIYKGVFLRKK